MTIAMESYARIWSKSQEEHVSAIRKHADKEKELMLQIISTQ